MPNFTKYIPLTEAEYRKFKEKQDKEIIQTQQELQRPIGIEPLSTAQNEKIETLFSKTPEADDTREQRYAQLFHIVNELKRKVDAQIKPQEMSEERKLPKFSFEEYKVKSTRNKAENLINMLGEETWNPKGELVINNTPIPLSKATELLNFAVSDWSTKYISKPPVGATEFLQLIQERNIPVHFLGKGIKSLLNLGPKVQGIAVAAAEPDSRYQHSPIKRKKPKISSEEIDDDKLQKRGYDVLQSSKKFKQYMKS